MTKTFPDFLYHYTTPQGLLNILKSRSLWLSGIHHLNDHSEGTIFFDFLNQLAASDSTFSADCIRRNLEEIEPYICCFSEEPDLLSQWRGYGANGSGFSIAFDRERIISLISEHSEWLLKKVTYADNYDEFINDQDNRRSRDAMEAFGKTYASTSMSLRHSLRKETLAIKHSGFNEECEYRLILTLDNPTSCPPLNLGATAILKHRDASTGVREYYELSWPIEQNKIISAVILGPKNDSKIPVVKRILEANGYMNTSICKSKLTYK